MMKLMTAEIEAKLPKLGSTDGVPVAEKIAVVKFFNPVGSFTWYAVEGEREDGDLVFFGLVIGFEAEWGYFTLSELESADVGFGLGIERDLYFEAERMRDVPELQDYLSS